LIFIINIDAASNTVIALEIITGRSLVSIPYKSHRANPTVNKIYIGKEIPLVFLDFKIFNAWGKKEIVVMVAAINPIIVV